MHFKNPHLPLTRSEMALPLVAGDEVIGAVTVQSTEEAAFSSEDISSLQAMADQLAVALRNASSSKSWRNAHAELVRTKTYEAHRGGDHRGHSLDRQQGAAHHRQRAADEGRSEGCGHSRRGSRFDA